jgi:hypothetical protein
LKFVVGKTNIWKGETKSRKNVKNVYDCLHSRFSRQKDKPTCEQEMNK